MTSCEECRELVGGFVLDALEPAETDAVREHLRECPACRAELDRLAELRPMLDLAGSMEGLGELPDPGLEVAVLEGFRRDMRRHPWRRLGGFLRDSPRRAALAGAVAGAAATIAVLGLLGALSGEKRRSLQVQLAGSSAAALASGEAELWATRSGTQVDLRVQRLRPTQGDELYELWLLGPDGRTSAGTFRVPASGTASTEMTAGIPVDRLLGVGVTLEPDAADPQRNGPNVLAGEIAG